MGWGCMIRAGQMMVFVVLMRHLGEGGEAVQVLKKYFNEKSGDGIDNGELLKEADGSKDLLGGDKNQN